MKKHRDDSGSHEELRRRAEELLVEQEDGATILEGRDPLALFHELQVYQIELEMQKDEFQRAQTESEKLREQYQNLYDFAPVGYLTLNDKNMIMGANLAGAQLLGQARSRLIGRTMFEFIKPEAISEFTMFSAKVRSGDKKERCELRLRGNGSEGTWVMAEGMYFGNEEQPGTWVMTLMDISARIRTEEALRISEEKFSKVFHSAPCLIGISTMDEGRFIDINETCIATLGYRPEEIIGRTAVELGIWEDPADRVRIIRTLEENGSVSNMEVRFRSKNGNIYTGLFSAGFVEIDNKRYLLAIVRDITDQIRATEEIRKLNTMLEEKAAALDAANKELDAFNYTVSHDLHNHLNSLACYCQLIRETCKDRMGAECLGYVEEAYNGVLRMEGFINSMLSFSSLSHAELSRKSFDLSALANKVALGLKSTNPSRRVEFQIAGGVRANGDPNLLRTVLENLLGNAFKYTGNKEVATIGFGAREEEGNTAYFISDNGAGFDMAEAEKLFIPFKRLHGAEEFRGNGIGLATVERIIRRHNGRVWAESEPGKGATFFFTLPI